MIVLRPLAVVCAVAIACTVTAAPDLHAFSVMGCNFNFGENPEGCINGKINEQINLAKNDANRKIDDANKKARDAQRQAGPFAPLVDTLQKEAILFLAESYVKETRLAIEHYNISVRELAEASARPR